MTGTQHDDSIANLSSKIKPQDTMSLKSFLLPVEDWSVSILPGSESVEDSQKLDPNRIVPILSSLLRAFDYVFVDLGKTLSNISQSVMHFSDMIAVVVGPDFLTAQLTQIALQHLMKIGIIEEKIFLILNRAVGLEGLTKMEMEERMGKTIHRTVRYARDNFTIATNRHLPYAVAYPDDAMTMELSNLAEMLGNFE
jgi:MinD-like ATPase involved in chromosome partitioning or flagellar assembly